MRQSMPRRQVHHQPPYQTIYDAAPVGICYTDSDGRILGVNRRLCDIISYQEEALLGQHWEVLIHPDDLESFRQVAADLLAGRQTIGTLERRFLTRDRATVWVRVTATAIRHADGNPNGLVGVIEDCTELERQRAAIREQNAFLRSVIDAIPFPFFVVDPRDHSVVHHNRLFRRPPGQIEPHCHHLYHGEHGPCRAPEAVCPLDHIAATGQPFVTEQIHLDAAGHEHLVEMHAHPIVGPDGRLAQVVEFTLDVTEQRRIQLELEREVSINAALAQLAKELITPRLGIAEMARLALGHAKWLTGARHGFVSHIDRETGHMVTSTLTEMMGKDCRMNGPDASIIFKPDANGRFRGLFGIPLATGEPLLCNEPARHPAAVGVPAGHVPLQNLLAVPVKLGDEVIGEVALANREGGFGPRDTEVVRQLAELYGAGLQRRRVESDLEQLNRDLEARIAARTRELANTVAQLETGNLRLRTLTQRLRQVRDAERLSISRLIHDDLGQELTGVKAAATWLEQHLRASGHAGQPALAEACREISRGIGVAINFARDLARELHPSLLDHLGLQPAIEWQASQFTRRTGIAVEFICEWRPSDVLKSARIEVFRIIQEALTNVARHAKATRVSIRLGRDGEKLVCSVTDNGCGIRRHPAHRQESLGLTVMHERAVAIGGTLIVQSRSDRGTTVTLSLPSRRRRGRKGTSR